MGYPRVYPTGVTSYDPERAYNGLTVFPSAKGALLIDMAGNEVQLWAGLSGFPNKILPGGYVLGSTGKRDPQHGYQDQLDLVQVDWDGHIVWRFAGTEEVRDPGEKPRFLARQHHDFQREGSSTGYYAPDAEPLTDSGKTLLLTHENRREPSVTDNLLLDDKFIEIDWDGTITWQWRALDHLDELGFDETQRNVIFRHPSLVPAGGGVGDWLHINSLSYLGPNKWYDAGDERFHPDNLIWDSRNANILAIISKRTGEIVWRLGPNFRDRDPLVDGPIGSTVDQFRLNLLPLPSQTVQDSPYIIGQHHLHLIPRGLPGEGNLLVFDNGGWGGYGQVTGISPTGVKSERRAFSRVLEFDPVTLDVVWQYTAGDAGRRNLSDFYSPFISSAQRLPNGNTLITEGSDGRIFEVTPEHETVWEYINPYYSSFRGRTLNMVYRAYRVPYQWVPQVTNPSEDAVVPPDISTFRVPASAAL